MLGATQLSRGKLHPNRRKALLPEFLTNDARGQLCFAYARASRQHKLKGVKFFPGGGV